jgi:hypothetical protein
MGISENNHEQLDNMQVWNTVSVKRLLACALSAMPNPEKLGGTILDQKKSRTA